MAVAFPQISLHVLSHLAGDDVLKEALRQGDVLEDIAKALSHSSAAAVTSLQRGTAVILTYFYMGAHWLSRRLLVTEEEAEQLRLEMSEYFESHFPLSMQYIKSQLEKAENWEKMTTLAGRRYAVVETQSRMGPIRSCARRRAAAFTLEGSVSDFQRLFVARLFRKYSGEVEVFPVFDFDVINVRKDQVQEVVDTIDDVCKNNGLGLELPFKWAVGSNLMEAFEALAQGKQ